MRFTKMHGAGNDFVVQDGRNKELPWGNLAKSMCDRHFGVGADGIILVLESEVADLRMRMFNPDGSEAEMCGNGIRCFAKFVLENALLPWGNSSFDIETLAGILPVQPILDGQYVTRVQVGMGVPQLTPELIPVDRSERLKIVGSDRPMGMRSSGSSFEYFMPKEDMVFDWPIVVKGKNFTITGVSMGNPHAVAFISESVEGIQLEEFGPQIEHHRLFPNRVNFEIVNVIDRRNLRARVWERGAGLTLACGSGASAIAVAARLHGYIDDSVNIALPGGTLSLSWDGKGQVYLEGPVEKVFDGEW